MTALAAFAALAFLVAPGQASAQFGGDDYCAERSPHKTPAAGFDPWKGLTLGVAGSGTVALSMYNTAAEPAACIQPYTPCTSTSSAVCAYQIQTVCSFHCYSHRHLDPQHWDVRLTPSGSNFLGWAGSGVCRPVSREGASRADCLLLMNMERSVTANFGAAPDSQAPTAPAPSVTPGRYDLSITWTASSDNFLAGYEIRLNGKFQARVERTRTQWKALSLSCDTPYTVEVIAFDPEHEARSAPVATRTGRCAPALRPRPNTVIHVKPRRTTRSRAAFFHFGVRGEIRATRYQCKLDKRRWARCSGVNGKRYRKLKKGWHTFQVRAGNAAGFDRTPAKWRWRVR